MASIHMHRRILRTALAFGAAALLVSALLFAASPVNTLKGGLFGGHSDTAILGYDTVAYFTLSKAVKGQDRFVYEWMGAKWKFDSQANLDRVKEKPEKSEQKGRAAGRERVCQYV